MSANKWKITTLGSVAKISRGSSPRPIHDFITSSGIPWVKIADATASPDRYLSSTKEFIRQEGKKKSTFVEPGDLIVSNSATPGIPKIMKIEACIHDGWLLFRDLQLDKYFLFYWLKNSLRELTHSASGSVFKNLKTDIVKNLEIKVPPISEQKDIAKTLSSLDEKIELLQKQNQTLELFAKTIYYYWFVDFNFPNEKGQPYKKSGGEMVDSELGEVPAGWKLGRFGEEFEIIMGQSPNGESFNLQGEGVVFFQGRTDFGTRFPSVRLYTSKSTRIAEANDILVSVRAPVGDINVALERCCIGRGLAAVRSNNPSYALYKTFAIQNKIRAFDAEGTVFGSIGKSDFNNISTVIPSPVVVETFSKTVKPLDSKILANYKQIFSLSKTRDLLLPKLMNGSLGIKN